MPEPIFMKLGMHNMATEPISTAHFINPSSRSAYLYVVLGNSSVKMYRGNEYTRKNITTDGRVVFYAIRVNQTKVGHYFFPEPLLIKVIIPKLGIPFKLRSGRSRKVNFKDNLSA
jgi:hypothetical protein